jgi:LPXTG-site transpeptidase (sortase) family protein
VLIGHRDTVAEGPGALFDLDEVQSGDPVVVRAGNRSLRYEVVSLRSIDKAALPDALFGRTGQPRLVLITCGGPYLPEAGGYQENVVVVARPVLGRADRPGEGSGR